MVQKNNKTIIMRIKKIKFDGKRYFRVTQNGISVLLESGSTAYDIEKALKEEKEVKLLIFTL